MSTPTDFSHVGSLVEVAIKDLLLDPINPRLPEAYRRGAQEDIAVVLEMGFDAFQVAQSIVDHGYFAGEPLLAVHSEEVPGKYVVVEGNRRLTSLLGLAYPEIRENFASAERWETVASKRTVTPDSIVPVLVHATRADTHAQVAKAHVVGKLPWRPYMQAKFIAARVSEGKTIAQVAEDIGIPKSKAADLYRDQAVVAQAEALGFTTSAIEEAFSLLTVAMSSTKLRDHVGAPLGSRLEPSTAPIPDEKTNELKELITWVFGDDEEDIDPVINDSRQISQLGNVVANEVGLQALRSGKSLEQAKDLVSQSGLDPLDRLHRRLSAARNALSSATEDFAEFANDQVVFATLQDIESLVESLRSVADAAEEHL